MIPDFPGKDIVFAGIIAALVRVIVTTSVDSVVGTSIAAMVGILVYVLMLRIIPDRDCKQGRMNDRIILSVLIVSACAYAIYNQRGFLNAA